MKVKHESKSRILLELITSYEKPLQEKVLLDKVKKKSQLEIENRFQKSTVNLTYIFPRQRDGKYSKNMIELDDIGLVYDLNSQNKQVRLQNLYQKLLVQTQEKVNVLESVNSKSRLSTIVDQRLSGSKSSEKVGRAQSLIKNSPIQSNLITSQRTDKKKTYFVDWMKNTYSNLGSSPIPKQGSNILISILQNINKEKGDNSNTQRYSSIEKSVNSSNKNNNVSKNKHTNSNSKDINNNMKNAIIVHSSSNSNKKGVLNYVSRQVALQVYNENEQKRSKMHINLNQHQSQFKNISGYTPQLKKVQSNRSLFNSSSPFRKLNDDGTQNQTFCRSFEIIKLSEQHKQTQIQ